MTRLFAGNPPRGADGWTRLDTILLDDEAWGVYTKPAPTDGWYTVKVSATRHKHPKPNFWGSVSAGGHRGRSADMALMAAHNGELYAQVCAVLAIHYRRQ